MTVETDFSDVTAAGNGVATVFPFTFDIFENGNLTVVKTNIDGTTVTLTEGAGSSNYSVSVSSYPGPGSITYPASGGTPLALGEYITILRVLDLIQDTDLNNQGGYFPEVQETTFDKIVMMIQQLQEQMDRSVKTEVGSLITPDELVESIIDAAAQAEAAAALVAESGVTQFTETQIGYGEAATQAETDAGVLDDKVVTPLKFKTGITNKLASQAEAEAGVDNTKLMTPLRTAQAITVLTPPSGDPLFQWLYYGS